MYLFTLRNWDVFIFICVQIKWFSINEEKLALKIQPNCLKPSTDPRTFTHICTYTQYYIHIAPSKWAPFVLRKSIFLFSLCNDFSDCENVCILQMHHHIHRYWIAYLLYRIFFCSFLVFFSLFFYYICIKRRILSWIKLLNSHSPNALKSIKIDCMYARMKEMKKNDE